MRWPTATTSSFIARRRSGRDLAGAATPCRRTRRPQLLEVVVLAYGRLHDVHDHRAEVHQYPFAGLLAFDAVDAAAAFAHLVLNAAGERPPLAVGVGAG